MSTYKEAGVDIDAGDRAVELMKAAVARAGRPEVKGGIGGCAGLFDAWKLKEMKQPLLATSTDGVGTKTEIGRGATTDTEIMTALIGLQDENNVEASARAVLPKLEGAFSLVFMDENTLYAARDRHGVRPLVLGKLDRGWVVASESAALDIVGAAFVREVEPGELTE